MTESEFRKTIIGQRVISGSIMQPRDYVVNFADGWVGIHREVSSLEGMLIFYWIKFDLPQMDSDGDGPYDEAEIDANYLLPQD